MPRDAVSRTAIVGTVRKNGLNDNKKNYMMLLTASKASVYGDQTSSIDYNNRIII